MNNLSKVVTHCYIAEILILTSVGIRIKLSPRRSASVLTFLNSRMTRLR